MKAIPSWAAVSETRRQHIERVGRLLMTWADALSVDRTERERWLRAAALHDALKDAPVETLRALAPRAWDRPALLHGPAAAAMAAQHGEDDRGVLDAVAFHSVGYARWDDVGRMLYLADFLEPGRTGGNRAEREQLTALVLDDRHSALRHVARARITMIIARDQSLLPETVDFWNSLRCVD